MTTTEKQKCNTLKQILGEIPTIQLGKGNEKWIKRKNKPNTLTPARFRINRKQSYARIVREETMAEEKSWMFASACSIQL